MNWPIRWTILWWMREGKCENTRMKLKRERTIRGKKEKGEESFIDWSPTGRKKRERKWVRSEEKIVKTDCLGKRIEWIDHFRWKKGLDKRWQMGISRESPWKRGRMKSNSRRDRRMDERYGENMRRREGKGRMFHTFYFTTLFLLLGL